MVKVYSPLTWGIYTTPPADIPECGFIGELCPTPVGLRGKLPYLSNVRSPLLIYGNTIVLTQARYQY